MKNSFSILALTGIILLFIGQSFFGHANTELRCPQTFVLGGQTFQLDTYPISSGAQKNGSFKCTYHDPAKLNSEKMTRAAVASFILSWRSGDVPTYLQMKCDTESERLSDVTAAAGKYVVKRIVHYSLEKQISVVANSYKGDETPEIKKFALGMMNWVFDESAPCKQSGSDKKTEPNPVTSPQTTQPTPKPQTPKPEWYTIFEKYCRQNPDRDMCPYWKGKEPNTTEQQFWKVHAIYCKENPNFDKCPKPLDKPWMKKYAQLCKEHGAAVEMCQGWHDGDQPLVSEQDFETKFLQYCKENPMLEICYQDNETWKIDVVKYCLENNHNMDSDICQEFVRNKGDIIREHFNEDFTKYCKENLGSQLCPKIGIEPWRKIIEERCRNVQEGTICNTYHKRFEKFTMEEFIEYCRTNQSDSICQQAYLEDWQLRLAEYCSENKDSMCMDWRSGQTPHVDQTEFEIQFERYCKGNLNDQACSKMVDADWNGRFEKHCQENPDASLCHDLLNKKQKLREAEFINTCMKNPDEKFCKKVFRSDWKIRYAQYCLENRDLANPDDICWRWSPGAIPSVTELEFERKFAQFCDGQTENNMCKRYIEVPTWIKDSTQFYVKGQTSHEEFMNNVQYLIKEKIINVPLSDSSSTSQVTKDKVKDMVRQNAEWWSNGLISDRDFVKHLEFLIKQSILHLN